MQKELSTAGGPDIFHHCISDAYESCDEVLVKAATAVPTSKKPNKYDFMCQPGGELLSESEDDSLDSLRSWIECVQCYSPRNAL